MYITKIKKKCSVRGCKNTESYAISQRRELGNSVIICKSCVSAAKAAIDEFEPTQKSNITKVITKNVPLFFNSVAQEEAVEEKKTKKRAEKQ